MVEIEASLGDVLIVDDNPGNLTVLLSMLSNAGYHVRSAINGEMALSAIEAAQPDLVLLDVNMPGMKGLDVCRAIKQDPATADIPVICASALRDFSDKQAAFDCGASDYVTKPFQFTEVFARVQTHISLRRQRQEIAALQQTLERRDLELVIEREKLQFIQEYFHMIAFDLRGPLQNIGGWVDILLQEYAEFGPSEVAPHIKENANRSLEVLDTYRFLPSQFHTHREEREKINLIELVEQLASVLHVQSRYGKQNLNIAADADKSVFIESYNGLLNCALAFVLDSVLTFTTDASSITLRVYDNSDMAVLEVEVSHVSEDDLSWVFTNPSAPTLVQNIVKLHDGRIEIERISERSGIFRILLPLLRD